MRRKDRDPGIKIKVFALRAVAVVVVVVVALLLILWLQERSSTRELANGEGSSILMDFPDHTEVAIAIVEDGQTRFHGVIKENQVLIPIKNEERVFEVGSITKLFTSVLLASLVNEGKVMLDDPIHHCLGLPPEKGGKITLLSLANHTSGLPRLPGNMQMDDVNNPYKNYRAGDLEEFIRSHWAEGENVIGNYHYSNLGTGLLGYLLGRSQGVSYEDLLQERVFSRYGMRQSYTRAEDAGDSLVKGLNAGGEVTSNWDFDALMGAGGALSTVKDLSAFASAQFNKEDDDLMLTRAPTHVVNDRLKMGLGWHILLTDSGKELHCHNGGTGGYSSSIAINMADEVAVIVLSNVSAFHPSADRVEQLCLQLIDRL